MYKQLLTSACGFCRKITPDIYGLPHGKVNAQIENERVVSINK